MTDRAIRPGTQPARRPLPSALNVITGTLGLFLVVLTLLALQVRSGRDPSLSTTTSSGTVSSGSASSAAATKSVVTKTS